MARQLVKGVVIALATIVVLSTLPVAAPRQPTERVRRVTLSFPAPALYEVKRWVLQWGADAEVLGPRRLREAVREEAARLQARYS